MFPRAYVVNIEIKLKLYKINFTPYIYCAPQKDQ